MYPFKLFIEIIEDVNKYFHINTMFNKDVHNLARQYRLIYEKYDRETIEAEVEKYVNDLIKGDQKWKKVFGNILNDLNITVLDKDHPLHKELRTMAVSDNGDLFINLDFVNRLVDTSGPEEALKQIQGVFAHEAMHIYNGTFTRQKQRDYNPKLWNYATDYHMNTRLLDAGLSLPDGVLSPHKNTESGEVMGLGDLSRGRSWIVMDPKVWQGFEGAESIEPFQITKKTSADAIYKHLEAYYNSLSEEGQQAFTDAMDDMNKNGDNHQEPVDGEEDGEEGEDTTVLDKIAQDAVEKVEAEEERDGDEGEEDDEEEGEEGDGDEDEGEGEEGAKPGEDGIDTSPVSVNAAGITCNEPWVDDMFNWLGIATEPPESENPLSRSMPDDVIDWAAYSRYLGDTAVPMGPGYISTDTIGKKASPDPEDEIAPPNPEVPEPEVLDIMTFFDTSGSMNAYIPAGIKGLSCIFLQTDPREQMIYLRLMSNGSDTEPIITFTNLQPSKYTSKNILRAIESTIQGPFKHLGDASPEEIVDSMTDAINDLRRNSFEGDGDELSYNLPKMVNSGPNTKIFYLSDLGWMDDGRFDNPFTGNRRIFFLTPVKTPQNAYDKMLGIPQDDERVLKHHIKEPIDMSNVKISRTLKV